MVNFFFNFSKKDKSFNLIINAHESTIAAIALNQDGTLLATASEKVNKIHITYYNREPLLEFLVLKMEYFYKKSDEVQKRLKFILYVLIYHQNLLPVHLIEEQYIFFH